MVVDPFSWEWKTVQLCKMRKWGKVEKRSKSYQIKKDETFIQKLGSFSWGLHAFFFLWSVLFALGNQITVLEIRTWCCRFLLWPRLLPCAWGVIREAFPPYPPEDFSSNCLPWLPLLLLRVHFQRSTSMTRAWLNPDASKYLMKKSASEVLMRNRGRTDVIVACLCFQNFFFEPEILSVVCCELLVWPFEYDESWLQNQFKVGGFLVLPRACVRSPGNPWDADFLWDACRRVRTSSKQ